MTKNAVLRTHTTRLLSYSPELLKHFELGADLLQAAQHTTLAAVISCITEHAITELIKLARRTRTSLAHRYAVTTMQLTYLQVGASRVSSSSIQSTPPSRPITVPPGWTESPVKPAAAPSPGPSGRSRESRLYRTEPGHHRMSPAATLSRSWASRRSSYYENDRRMPSKP